MHSEEEVPVLTEVGWFVVETIERMTGLQFSLFDICDALEITPDLHDLLLAKAHMERTQLERDLRGL